MSRIWITLALLTASIVPASCSGASDEVPAFWKSLVSDVEAVLKTVKKGEVRQLGLSWGHRPLYAVSYGQADPYTRTTNFSAAVLAANPEAFCKRAPGAKPVLMIIGPVHGGEMEGVAGCVNLIKILETGTDFRGKAWPAITENAAKMRIVIIPVGNPDGRARLPFDSYVGRTTEFMRQYSQGTHKDGKPWGWPTMVENMPMVGDVGILGACFNDGGVNVYDDYFFDPQAPETRMIINLALEEAPDFIVHVHSHEMPAEFLKTYIVPPLLTARTGEIQKQYADMMKERGLPVTPPRETPSDAFEFSDAIFHVCGAVSMVFEGPEGLIGEADKPIGYDAILDSHLTMHEFLIRLGASPEGYMGRKDARRGNWISPNREF
jgi:hypothetical protein